MGVVRLVRMIPALDIPVAAIDHPHHQAMRIAPLSTIAALLIAAPLAAQAPAADSAAVATPAGPSVVFVAAGRAGPALALAPLVAQPTGLALAAPSLPDDTLRKKRRAIEHSDAYYTRLSIHRWASYTMPPLFVAQYALGQKLIRARDRGEDPGSTKGLHSTVAGGIAGLFAINTVTGVWNLYEDRSEPQGRARRLFHVVTMLAADAGFVATGLTAEDEGGEGGEGGGGGGGSDLSTHRNLAYGSMGLALVSGAVMWFWKD